MDRLVFRRQVIIDSEVTSVNLIYLIYFNMSCMYYKKHQELLKVLDI